MTREQLDLERQTKDAMVSEQQVDAEDVPCLAKKGSGYGTMFWGRDQER